MMRVAMAQEPSASHRPIGVAISTTYLPELESLRGIAMLLVLFFHLDAAVRMPLLKIGGETVSPALAYVKAGHAGVGLFFVLSAFLLSLPFLAEAAGGRSVPLRQYGARRALRILPIYYVAVIAGTLLSARTPSDLLNGAPYLLFLNSIAGMTTGLPPYSNVWWSLATEAQFYLLLPFVPLAFGSRRANVAGAAAILLWALAYAAYVGGLLGAPTINGQLLLGLSVFGRAPLFLAGIAAAWLYLHYGDAMRRHLAALPLMRYGGGDLLLLGVLTSLGYLLRWAVWIGAQQVKAPIYQPWHLPEAAAWAAILLVLLVVPLRLKPLLSNRVLSRLGVLSYSIYILHVPVFMFGLPLLRSRWQAPVGWNSESVVFATILCLLCVALAELTYRNIERPFLLRKERTRDAVNPTLATWPAVAPPSGSSQT